MLFEKLAIPMGHSTIMQTSPYVHNRAHVDAATDLINAFGNQAAEVAKSRAHESRNLGNVVKYCHWRQVERLIASLDTEAIDRTIH